MSPKFKETLPYIGLSIIIFFALIVMGSSIVNVNPSTQTAAIWERYTCDTNLARCVQDWKGKWSTLGACQSNCCNYQTACSQAVVGCATITWNTCNNDFTYTTNQKCPRIPEGDNSRCKNCPLSTGCHPIEGCTKVTWHNFPPNCDIYNPIPGSMAYERDINCPAIPGGDNSRCILCPLITECSSGQGCLKISWRPSPPNCERGSVVPGSAGAEKDINCPAIPGGDNSYCLPTCDSKDGTCMPKANCPSGSFTSPLGQYDCGPGNTCCKSRY